MPPRRTTAIRKKGHMPDLPSDQYLKGHRRKRKRRPSQRAAKDGDSQGALGGGEEHAAASAGGDDGGGRDRDGNGHGDEDSNATESELGADDRERLDVMTTVYPPTIAAFVHDLQGSLAPVKGKLKCRVCDQAKARGGGGRRLRYLQSVSVSPRTLQ
ncbi:hypothetical protein HK101_006608 [Irineochytrium annulatum]|nr:hypothetical protein HK101_006608 [Irineochytrium annulatum]